MCQCRFNVRVPILFNVHRDFSDSKIWGTNMTGRPGDRTIEMIGGSAVSYLVHTPLASMWFCVLQ